MAKRKIQTGDAVPIVDAFDAIAKSKQTAAKTSGIPTIKLSVELAKNVDTLITTKAQIAALEANKAAAEERLNDVVSVDQEQDARKGNFSKSYYLHGTTDTKITYTKTDKFSAVDSDIIPDLKTLIGDEKYDLWFEKKRNIKFLAAENKDLMAKIMAAITAAGLSLAEVFEVTDTIVAKPGLDEKQFELSPVALAKFKVLVKQNKASFKI